MGWELKRRHVIGFGIWAAMSFVLYPKYAAGEKFLFGLDPVIWMIIPVVAWIGYEWLQVRDASGLFGEKIVMENPMVVWDEFLDSDEFRILTPGSRRYSLQVISKGDTGDYIWMANFGGDKYIVIMDGRVGSEYRHPTVMRWNDVRAVFPTFDKFVNLSCPMENVTIAKLLASMDEESRIEFLTRSSGKDLSRMGLS